MSMKSWIKKTENLFIIDGCLGTAIYILTNGTVLSGYAYYLGATESTISIIATIPILVNASQIFSARIFQRRSKNKRLIIWGMGLHRIGLGLMFLLPFLDIGSNYKVMLLAASYGLAYFFYAFVATGHGDWMLHSVDPAKHGKFLGLKDSLSLAALSITSLIVGKMLDYYEAITKEDIGFMVIGIAIIVMAIMNVYDLLKIDEVETPVAENKGSILQDIILPFQDERFRKVIYFYGLWNIALYLANSFYAIFMVGYLDLPYFFIMSMTMLSAVSRIISSVIWGKLADRISWMWVNRCSVTLLACSVISWVFVGNINYMWILPINQIMAGCAWGGIAISVFNIQYAFAPAENKVLYVSVNTALTSIIGFCSTLLGVRLMAIFPTVIIGGFTVYGIQWAILVSGILMLGTALFNRVYLENN